MRDTSSEPVSSPEAHTVHVQLTAVLAELEVPVDTLLELRAGAVLHLGRRHDAPLTALVNGAAAGRGRALDAGDRLAFRFDTVAIADRGQAAPPER